MLLVIDIGNTNIKFGLFDGERLAHSWRLATNRKKTGDEYGASLCSLLDLAGINKDVQIFP